MKIAVTSKANSLDAQVDPRFGRCAYFILVDTDDMKWEAIENPNAAAGGGAGIQSAQLMVDRDVKAVLTGNCGPNSFQVLEAGGIEVIVGVTGTVKEAVEAYKAGKLQAVAGANVADHFGMAGGGGGRGMGRGRGMALRSAPAQTDELAALKAQAQQLAEQLQAIQKRIDELTGNA